MPPSWNDLLQVNSPTVDDGCAGEVRSVYGGLKRFGIKGFDSILVIRAQVVAPGQKVVASLLQGVQGGLVLRGTPRVVSQRPNCVILDVSDSILRRFCVTGNILTELPVPFKSMMVFIVKAAAIDLIDA